MEQYDVYASRSNLLDQTATLNRSHGKLKRDQSDFIEDAFKPNSMKVPRHSQLAPVESSSLPVGSTAPTSELTATISINTMSVLPRLLRTMTNGSNGQSVLTSHDAYASSSIASTGSNGKTSAKATATTTATSSFADMADVESSSCLSSGTATSPPISCCFTCTTSPPSLSSSTTTSNSSFISFLSPVAAMAAAALSSSAGDHHHQSSTSDLEHEPVASGGDTDHGGVVVGRTTSSGNGQETSGLVTLATASSLIEREWLTSARTSMASGAETAGSPGGGVGGLVEAGVEHDHQSAFPGEEGRPGVVNKTSPLINGATPVTHAVLDVHSLAALICETRKHCTASRTPGNSLTVPGSTVATIASTATTNLTDSCTDVRMVVAPERDRHEMTTLDVITGQDAVSAQSQTVLLEGGGVNEALSVSQSPGKSMAPATAFISLRPAPGSLLASSNFQQLMASGEFMSPTARQTLLGQTSDGGSQQLYLLVPTDCPVIMSRQSNAHQQQSAVVDDPLSASSPPPPILESLTVSTDPATSAPILEAISPDISAGGESDTCTVQYSTGMAGIQPVNGLSQLTTAAASPTALSTLIAGLGATSSMNQQQHHQHHVNNNTMTTTTTNHHHQQHHQHHHHHQQQHQQVSPTASAEASSVPSTSAAPSQSVWGTSASTDPLRLPGIGVVSVSSGIGFLPTVDRHEERFTGTETATVRASDVNAILGAVKSDPDMYTPNGHLYTGSDDIGRFRCYPTVLSHPPTNGGGIGSTNSQSSPVTGSLLRGNTTATVSSTAPTGANFFHLASSSSLPPAQSSSSSSSTTAAIDLHHLQHPSLLLSQTGGLQVSPTASASMLGVGGATTTSNGGGLHLHQHLSSTGITPSAALLANPTAAAAAAAVAVAAASTRPSASASSTSLSQAAAAAVVASKPSVLQPLVIEDCQRHSSSASSAAILTPTSVNRIDSTTTAYLGHINSESKDIRRRVSHNEVERRRRDRINTWISELYKLLPPDEQAKSQYQSKGMVLKRVFEYFQNVDSMLNAANTAVEQTRIENGVLRQRVRDLQSENQLLSASLQLGAAAAAVQLKHRQPLSSGSSSALKGGVGGLVSGKSCADEEVVGETAGGGGVAMANGGELPSISVVSHLRHPVGSLSGVRMSDQLTVADYQPTSAGTAGCNGSAPGTTAAGGVTLFTVGAGGLVTEYAASEQPHCDPVAGSNAVGGLSVPTVVSSLPAAGNPNAGAGVLVNTSLSPVSLAAHAVAVSAAGSVLSRPVITLPSLELVTGAGASTPAGSTNSRGHAECHRTAD